jgi:hypothetical protein
MNFVCADKVIRKFSHKHSERICDLFHSVILIVMRRNISVLSRYFAIRPI